MKLELEVDLENEYIKKGLLDYADNISKEYDAYINNMLNYSKAVIIRDAWKLNYYEIMHDFINDVVEQTSSKDYRSMLYLNLVLNNISLLNLWKFRLKVLTVRSKEFKSFNLDEEDEIAGYIRYVIDRYIDKKNKLGVE